MGTDARNVLIPAAYIPMRIGPAEAWRPIESRRAIFRARGFLGDTGFATEINARNKEPFDTCFNRYDAIALIALIGAGYHFGKKVVGSAGERQRKSIADTVLQARVAA